MSPPPPVRYVMSLLLSLYRYQEEKREKRGKRRHKHRKADGGEYIEQLKRRVDRLEERKLIIENELSKRGEQLHV